jgi:glycine cleavage system H lipoate-binding protein
MQKPDFKHRAKKMQPPDCIWGQAGVIPPKTCKLDYRCQSCHFDKMIRRIASENQAKRAKGIKPEGKRGNIVFWQDKLMALPPRRRPCVHHLKQRIGFRACTHDYRCSDCEFDQYFQDEFTVHAVVKPVSVMNVDGFKIPQGYYLHRGHAWVKIEEESEVRVGLDDFALRLLGPPDAVLSPLVGKVMEQNRPQIEIRRAGKTASVLSPVSGVVTSVNTNLRERGRQAAQSPYTGGWILRIHTRNLRPELKDLMIGDETGTFLKSEIEQVYQAVENVSGPLAADGGFLGDDIYGSLPELGWEKLTQTFPRN